MQYIIIKGKVKTAQDFQSNLPEQLIIPTVQDNSHSPHFTLTDTNHNKSCTETS